MDLFWTFRRKIPIILPLTLEYFSVCRKDGRLRPRFDNENNGATYDNPTVSLNLKIKQTLDICGVPWAMRYRDDSSAMRQFTVYYSEKEFRKCSYDRHTYDCQMQVLKELTPHLVVRAKDFILVNSALEEVRSSLEPYVIPE